jgi:hypothetical protein
MGVGEEEEEEDTLTTPIAYLAYQIGYLDTYRTPQLQIQFNS